MTFRTQILKKKFGKKCFRTIQGTMSHRLLTNTLSLKIAAAYCTPLPIGVELRKLCANPKSSIGARRIFAPIELVHHVGEPALFLLF